MRNCNRNLPIDDSSQFPLHLQPFCVFRARDIVGSELLPCLAVLLLLCEDSGKKNLLSALSCRSFASFISPDCSSHPRVSLDIELLCVIQRHEIYVEQKGHQVKVIICSLSLVATGQEKLGASGFQNKQTGPIVLEKKFSGVMLAAKIEIMNFYLDMDFCLEEGKTYLHV